MEITGLDGTFTTTCRNVMSVMRKHKESLMALLEAFLYDPLLNWRLIEGMQKIFFSFYKSFFIFTAQPKAKTTLFTNGLIPGAGGGVAGGANNQAMNEEMGMLIQHLDDGGLQDQQQHHQQQMQLQHAQHVQQKALIQQQMQQMMQQQDFNAGPPGAVAGDAGGPQALKKAISSIRQQHLERKLETLGVLGVLGGSEGQLNSKAVAVVERVRHKLTGLDFENSTKAHGVLAQVDMLIKSATSHENLCQCYIGWCPFW